MEEVPERFPQAVVGVIVKNVDYFGIQYADPDMHPLLVIYAKPMLHALAQ
jgi:hypothetical protein